MFILTTPLLSIVFILTLGFLGSLVIRSEETAVARQ